MFNWFKKKKKDTVTINTGNTSIAGRFNGTVYRKDGSVKQVIPEQCNIVTDFGMRCFGDNFSSLLLNNVLGNPDALSIGSGSIGNGTFSVFKFGLVVGDGVASPAVTDKNLNNTALVCISRDNSGNNRTWSNNESDYELPNSEHPNYVKCSTSCVFEFSPEVSAYNLTELGLAFINNSITNVSTYILNFEKYYKDSSFKSSLSDSAKLNYLYALLTHANFKDNQGNNMTVSLEPGDKLDVTYTLDFYVDIRPVKGDITVRRINSSKQTVTENFEYTCTFMGSLGRGSLTSYPPIAPTFKDTYTSDVNKGIVDPYWYISEEEEPTSDFSNFDIDDYTQAVLEYRNQAFNNSNVTHSKITLSQTDSWYTPTISTSVNSTLFGYKIVDGIIKNLSYVDPSYLYDTSATYLGSESNFYITNSGVAVLLNNINSVTKSYFITSSSKNAYGQFDSTNYPTEYALYPNADSIDSVALIRYTIPCFNYDRQASDSRLRAILFHTNQGSINKLYYASLLVFRNKANNRGLQKTATEYFQWCLKTTLTRYVP